MHCGDCGNEQDGQRFPFCGRCGAQVASARNDQARDDPARDVAAHQRDPDDSVPEAADPRDRPRWLALAVVAAIALVVLVQFAGGDADRPQNDEGAPAAADGAGGIAHPPADPDPEPDRGPVPAPDPEGPTGELTATLEDVWCWARDTGESQGGNCAAWAAASEAGPITHLATLWRRVFAADAAGVTGLDAANGARLWRWESPAAPAQLMAAGERLVVVDADGRLVALDATSGIPVWAVGVPDWLGVDVDGGAVAVRQPGSLTLYAGDDGAVRWSVELPRPAGDQTPLLAGDLVVVSVEARANHDEARQQGLRAYDRDTGAEVWRSSFVPVQPLSHWPGDDLLLVGGADVLAAIEVATGLPVWTQPLDSARQVVDLDASDVALLRPARIDVIERVTGGEVASLEAPRLRHLHAAAPGKLLVDAGGAVQYSTSGWPGPGGGPACTGRVGHRCRTSRLSC